MNKNNNVFVALSIFIFAGLLLLVPMNLTAQQTTIEYGDCLQSSIDRSGEIDAYMFTGNKDDVITVQAGVSTGSLDPQVEVHDSNGLLKRASGSSSARIDTLRLPGVGLFAIWVLDGYNGTLTGDYGLCLQRISSGQGTVITYGARVPDALPVAGYMDAYTFVGNKNDVITVQVGVVSGSLDPQVEAYAPNGSLLKKAEGSSSARIDTLRLPSDGVFTILVTDGYNGTLTGNYGLALQRTFNPGRATAMNYGTTVPDTIAVSGYIKAYAFPGRSEDVITVQVGVSSGSLDPQVEVYAPDGFLFGKAMGSSSARIVALKLPSTGLFTLLVLDGYNGTLTGEYSISLAGFTPVSVKEQPAIKLPLAFDLQQNYPNPFNAMTTIHYVLPKSTHVMVAVYDVLGQKVAELVNEEKQAGVHHLQFNAGNLSNGIYFYRLQAAGHNETRKLRILR